MGIPAARAARLPRSQPISKKGREISAKHGSPVLCVAVDWWLSRFQLHPDIVAIRFACAKQVIEIVFDYISDDFPVDVSMRMCQPLVNTTGACGFETVSLCDKHPQSSSFAENARKKSKIMPSCIPGKPRCSCTKGESWRKSLHKGHFSSTAPRKTPNHAFTKGVFWRKASQGSDRVQHEGIILAKSYRFPAKDVAAERRSFP